MQSLYRNNMKLLSLLLLLAASFNVCAQKYVLKSPDQKLRVEVHVGDSIRYSVFFKEQELIRPSVVSMVLDNLTLGDQATVKKAKNRNYKSVIHPPYGKSAELIAHYNELQISFTKSYSLVFRAYNEGVAYRFVTDFKDSVKVKNEIASFKINGSPGAFYPETGTYTSWEVPYVEYKSVSDIKAGQRAITPALFAYGSTGIKLMIAEADLFAYPGMYLRKEAEAFSGDWAAYPAKTEMGSWGNFVSVVKERKDFIAKTADKRDYPWRVIIATDNDADLLTNELIYKLSGPSAVKDQSWIKPGKATWEWWHDAMLPGADIPSGMKNRNTVLYKYYIDFAARHKLEYIMIDAGWSNVYDLKKPNPDVDIQEVIGYGARKKVAVFLWCVATSLLTDLDQNLDYLKGLGAAGIKVDFFDRDDQEAIEWMERIAKVAAEKRLMVNFHGCAKPAGLQRRYPNVVNYEAVRGAECSKWDYTANPRHHLLIPFIRMAAGPMDYTPGSMRNRQKETFKPVDPGLPFTQGTRCHELAMYVLYDQPFAMLCDSPTEYEKYQDIMKYLSAVPVSFDETRVLSARLGEYALVAKRKQKEWFIGAMADWAQRDLKVDFSFLPDGVTLTAEVYRDGKDADKNAEQYEHTTLNVNNRSVMDLHLAPGGGAVIYLHP